jgi:hypothetical protein
MVAAAAGKDAHKSAAPATALVLRMRRRHNTTDGARDENHVHGSVVVAAVRSELDSFAACADDDDDDDDDKDDNSVTGASPPNIQSWRPCTSASACEKTPLKWGENK